MKPRLAVYAHGGGPLTMVEARKTYGGPLEDGEDLMTIEIGLKLKCIGTEKTNPYLLLYDGVEWPFSRCQVSKARTIREAFSDSNNAYLSADAKIRTAIKPNDHLPIFPAGVTEINNSIAVQKEAGQVVYIHGHWPVFHHDEEASLYSASWNFSSSDS